MADQTTLESLQGLKEFQDSDLSTRLGWVDNFSNLMFKEGRMDEAQKALDFRTQLEVQGASQEPVNQIMGSLVPNVRSIFTGAVEEPTLVDTIGEERYNQINQSYSRAKDMLESEGQPVKIGEDFVFVQKNPFGPGSLLKYEGGTKFLEDGQASPEAVKQLTEAEKLSPIKKDKVYGDLLTEITPDFNAETVLQKDTVSSLISDPRFSALSMGDQRNLLRYQRLALKNIGTTTEMEVANQALEMLNREEETMLAAGEMAGPLRETKLLNPATWNWYQNSWERGIQKVMLEADKREMRASFSARDALRKGSTPEELAAFDRNQDLLNDISTQFYEGFGADPWAPGELEKQLEGTGLEGIPKSKVVAYARSAAGFQKHEQNYILRNKAIAMIPQLEGMKQFQSNQARLESEGATWQEKSAQGVKDFTANPLDTVVAATLESFVSQPVTTVGTAALFAIPGGQGVSGAAVATRLAQATGSGLLAASTESSFTWTEEFEKARRLPDGSERPIEDILADPIAIKEINDKALGRGAAIGTVQGVTGWILPGSMNALDRFFASRGARAWQQGVFAGTQVVTQAGSEGGGELLAQQTEWDTNVGEVLLEMAAGFGGPDTLTMWQAPEAMRQARQDVKLETEANRILNEAKAAAAAREEISPEAVVTESQEIQGIFAQGISLQIETGEVDAKGNQEIHVFYETDEVGDTPSPEATVNQGLETVIAPPAQDTVDEEVAQETRETPTTPAEPIQDVSQIQEDQTVSVINDDGSVTSGPAKFNPAGNLVIDGKVQKTFPGKVWNGTVQPKPKPNLSRGDVLFDGNAFYEYDDAKDDYIIGQKNQDGTIQFDSTERANLTDGFIRDPRVTAYAKADFDSALQEYNATPGEKFGEILRRTPQKGQEGASSDTEVQSATAPAETPTEGAPKGPTEAELNEQAQTPVLQSPVGKRRTTAFKLRAHKDVNTLLGKAVDRFQDWMKRTKVLEKQENFIRYAKDGRVQELHRTQDPENFDERVNQLTEEDQDFRNYREPTKWNEVEHYRNLEVFLRNRIKRTQQSTNAKKSDKGILESAQVDSILQALFIQDRAIAATVSARFALYSPNGSLITVEDVAQLRYGSVESWKNPNSFTKTKAAYNSLARTLMLGGNASVVDVFHELYHDYLSNIAPLVLTEGQFNRLQKYIEARMAQPRFREFMRKSYKLKDTDFVFYQDGQISEAAQEAFVQMLTRWHYDGRLSQGMDEQDVPVLEAISGFFQRTFQDLDRTPITVTTDDAADLLGNFFLVPPSLRRQAFTPDARQARINREFRIELLNDQELSDFISGDSTGESLALDEDAQLPASPQLSGDKLLETYRPGEQPEDGKPFMVVGRSYVTEGDVTYEIIQTPAGTIKVPRDEQDKPFNDQTAQPQVEGATVPTGTQDVPDELIPQTAATKAGKKPLIVTRIPQEDGSTRIQKTDPETGMVISDRVYKKRQKKEKTWNPPEPVLDENPYPQYPAVSKEKPGEGIPGVKPENRIRMMQGGNYNVVTLIADPLDKEILSFVSRFKKKAEQVPGNILYQVKRRNGLEGREAEKYIFGRAEELKDIAKSVRNPNAAIIVNMFAREAAPRDTLYSLEDTTEPTYKMGRMDKRIIGGERVISKALQEIAEQGLYPEAPTAFIMEQVEARMNQFKSMKALMQDIAKLLRKSDDGLSRVFDPEDRYKGIGLAAMTYYLLAAQSQLNHIGMMQDAGTDLPIDRPTTILYQKAIHMRLQRLQRGAGRAINISKNLLTYSPEIALELIEQDTIRNNRSFKRYLEKAIEFGERYRGRTLTDSQFDAAMAEAQISPIFKKPLRLYSRDPKRSARDLELDAAKIWSQTPGMPGNTRPEAKALLAQLSERAQNAEYDFVRDIYQARANLLVQAERGVGIIDSLNAMYYNTLLFAISVTKINVIGFFPQYFLNAITDFMAWVAMDAIREGVTSLPSQLNKNARAVAAGLRLVGDGLREGAVEATAVGAFGFRGHAVEALEKGLGSVVSSQTLLFGRPGTNYADRKNVFSFVRRFALTLAAEAGRRNATSPSAMLHLLSEYTNIGALLYRDAWDSYYAMGANGNRDEFIKKFMDERLNVKSREQYMALAEEEIKAGASALIQTSIGIFPSVAEMATLKHLIAGGMRRNDIEKAVGESIWEDSQRTAFKNNYANDPRGFFQLMGFLFNNISSLGPLSKNLGAVARTHEGIFGKGDVRWRWTAGGPLAPSLLPFGGNIARMMETFATWTPLGIVNTLGTNAYFAMEESRKNLNKKPGQKRYSVNKRNVYTEMEVAGNMVRGAIGTLALVSMVFMLAGGDDEEKERGMTGHRSRNTWGRNGKSFLVPGYSFWWRTKNGDIAWAEFGEHPALLATFGVGATFAERQIETQDGSWMGMFWRVMGALGSASTETGAYDSIVDIAANFKALDEEQNEKWGDRMAKTIANNAKNYALPLNRLSKEMIVYEQLGGRGFENRFYGEGGWDTFWATFYMNTYVEGMLSEDQFKEVDKLIGDDGKVKKPDLFLERIGGILKQPTPGMMWMRQNNFAIQRTDYNKSLASLFSRQAQQDTAEAEFAKINNGMFYVEHASEIEQRASDYYWDWIADYSENTERKAELEAFVNSGTNKLKKEQGEGAKDIRGLQQQDINDITRRAREIAQLEVAVMHYTDNQRVIGWANAIAAQKAKKGYKDALKTYKVNPQLEQSQ